MDGFEASKFIRTNFKPPKSNVPIIALTANAIKGDDEKCIQAGMNDYISKPFLPETLRTKIVSNMNLEGFTRKVAPMIKQQSMGTKSIDLTFLKEMSENDSNFIADLIQSFITQFPKDMENVWFHFQNAEYDDVANLIHKIKPSITFMGIHELKDLVVEIEDNAKKRQIDTIEDQLKLVDKICKKAIAELLDELPVYKK
jgi:CheY-like chemotaxis protein